MKLTSGLLLPDFFSDCIQFSKAAHKWQWKCYDLKIHICIGSTGSSSGSGSGIGSGSGRGIGSGSTQ